MKILAQKGDRILVYDRKAPGVVIEYSNPKRVVMKLDEFWADKQSEIIEKLMR